MSGGHGHDPAHEGGPHNKKIALLIAVLALVLAFAETLGKGAQTSALSYNIEAANLWAFFQAKTIRLTTVRTAAETAEAQLLGVADPRVREAMERRVGDWKNAAARYDSEPDTQEGRKELSARAKASETKRDRALAAYHHFEMASGAMQIAIVLSSAAIITGVPVLVWIAGGLGLVGLALCMIAIVAPTAVHLF
jgi:Domain of unknown function (DUF4337)